MLMLPRRAVSVFLACLVAALALLLRVLAVGVDGFWMDEIFGASYCNLNIFELLIAVLRFDIHPPLYYLQLKLWSLLGHSDAWLLSNSIAWGLAAVALAGFGTARRFGLAAGLAAACFCAVLGSELFYSAELRMYSMISALVLAAWFIADGKTIEDHAFPKWRLLILLALLAAVHSAAFLAVGCVLLYVMPGWRGGWPVFRRGLRPWSQFAVLVAVCLVPWLINASVRHVSHTLVPGPMTIAHTLGGWLLGYGQAAASESLHVAAGGVVVVAVAALLVLGQPEERRTLFSFVVFPVVFAATVSLVARPIWLDRTMAFCAPFFAICVAASLARHASRRPGMPRSIGIWACSGGFVMLLAWLGAQQALTPRKQQYREAADFLAATAQPGATIYVPFRADYWAVARYLVGPDWGNMLAVQDPVNPDSSLVWPKIYEKIGPQAMEFLHLRPQTRSVMSPHGLLWIGDTPLPTQVVNQGYWMLVSTGAMAGSGACGSFGVERTRKTFTGIVLVWCDPT